MGEPHVSFLLKKNKAATSSFVAILSKFLLYYLANVFTTGGKVNTLSQWIPASEASPALAIIDPEATIISYLEDYCPCKSDRVTLVLSF